MFFLHLEFQNVDILGSFVQRQQGESILRKSQMRHVKSVLLVARGVLAVLLTIGKRCYNVSYESLKEESFQGTLLLLNSIRYWILSKVVRCSFYIVSQICKDL